MKAALHVALNAALRAALAFLQRLLPARDRVAGSERLRAFGGAAVGILFTGLVSRSLADHGAAVPWLFAPLGASAVLVFALPASPLAQPWAVIGGNTLSALIGIACARAITDPALAAAAAVGLAIAVMFALRCLHPPGGATALLVVLSQTQDYRFALLPVMFDSGLLVLAGVLYNSVTGRRYPHPQATPRATVAGAASRFSSVDLDAALAHYNQVLDVSRDDLEALLHEAEARAYQRSLGALRCADIMSREPHAVEFGSSLREAWGLMRRHRIKALPVVDRARRIAGIVTVTDFMRHADVDEPAAIAERLKAFIRRVDTTHATRPEVVGQIMTRQVRVASEDRHVIELVPLFSHEGHHHIPVIDADRRLVGIITQSDLVRALYGAVQGAQITAEPATSPSDQR